MNVFRTLFKTYVFESYHAALAVAAFCTLSFLQTSQPIHYSLLVFVFGATALSYHGIKHSPLKLTKWIRLKPFGLFLVTLISATQLPNIVLALAFFFGIISVLYTIPFSKKYSNVRNWGGVKIYIIAFCWSGVSVLLPLLSQGEFPSNIFQLLLIRFLIVFVLTLPFEIRDLPTDPAALKTIPMVFGVRRTKGLGLLVLALSLTLSLRFDLFNYIDGSMMLLIGILLWGSRVDRSKYYASFWVESVPLVWVLAYYLKGLIL